MRLLPNPVLAGPTLVEDAAESLGLSGQRVWRVLEALRKEGLPRLPTATSGAFALGQGLIERLRGALFRTGGWPNNGWPT